MCVCVCVLSTSSDYVTFVHVYLASQQIIIIVIIIIITPFSQLQHEHPGPHCLPDLRQEQRLVLHPFIHVKEAEHADK